MKVKLRRKGMREYVCRECGAIHYYHYRKCGRCGTKNPVKPNKRNYTTKKFNSPDSKQIAILAAVVHSVKSCSCKKAKKDILYDSFREHNFLVNLFRITYDPNIELGIKSLLETTKQEYGSRLWDTIKSRINKQSGRNLTAGRWIGILSRTPAEFHGVMNGILDKTFRLGLNIKGINRVLRRMKLTTIPTKKERKSC